VVVNFLPARLIEGCVLCELRRTNPCSRRQSQIVVYCVSMSEAGKRDMGSRR
jgi:hypothetical protein